MIRPLTSLGILVALATGVGAEVLQLAAGPVQSAALVTGGDVFEWGEWGGTLPVSVFGVDQVKAIAVGGHHLLALGKDGGVWAWGANEAGQLGNGTVFKSDRPGRVMDITGAIAIATAGSQSYALKNDGTVWAWGSNRIGQLGDGTTNDRRGPVLVEGLIDVTAIAAGTSILLALHKDGSVCQFGGISTGTQTGCQTTTPYHNVTAIAAADDSAYLLLRDGTVRGSGGCASSFVDKDLVLDDVRAISANGSHLIMLRDDATVWECEPNATHPAQVSGGLTGASLIAAGPRHGLAYNSGGIWAWGDNSAGQLGIGKISGSGNGPIWDGTGRLH